MSAEAGERVALVTGGTDGIVRAVALGLARGGDRVLFVGRSAERGARVLAELREARPGPEHTFLPADLSRLSETARVADEVALRLTDRLDAAVFCAGILSSGAILARSNTPTSIANRPETAVSLGPIPPVSREPKKEPATTARLKGTNANPALASGEPATSCR
jgi:NAD(P)-dependent dehydrogenase (short-subunit alcohol dehydrogenase family)